MGSNCTPVAGCEAVLKALRTEYDGVMVYLCDKHTLTPWQWCNAWPQAAPQQKVDMKQKSAFHVVLRNNDYHGAVAPNDYLRSVLSQWNLLEWPVTLTMTALKHNAQQLAVVLCWSRLDKSHLSKLDFVQAQAAKLRPLVMKAKGIQNESQAQVKPKVQSKQNSSPAAKTKVAKPPQSGTVKPVAAKPGIAATKPAASKFNKAA